MLNTSPSSGRFLGRASAAAVLALLVLPPFAMAQEPAAPGPKMEAKEKAGKAPTPGQIAIDRKLDAIVIPKFFFKDTSFDEAIEFLRMRATELDQAEEKPHLKGMNMVILPSKDAKNPAKSDRITLKKDRISLREALMEVCQQGGMKFRVDDAAVAFYPAADEADQTPAKQEGEAADLARKLLIPRIDLEETTLEEAVDFLNLRVRDMREEEPVFPIVFAPGADPTVKIESLRLRNAPLSEVLRYCTEATGHRWVATGKELRIERQ